VSRIALVKPEKARNVENMILAAAQRGALQSKVRKAAPATQRRSGVVQLSAGSACAAGARGFGSQHKN
jgi:hypothetical protein